MDRVRHPEPSLNLFDACYRHRVLMFVIFVFASVAGVAYLYLAKKKYTSQAKLFVRLGKETVGLDPTATTGQTVSIQESRDKEIYSVQTLLQSRGVLEQVVDQVGVEKVLEETESDEESLLPIDLGYIKSLSPTYVDSPRDKAIEMLEEGLEVFSPRKTAILELKYETISPELAAEIIGTVISVATESHVRIHQASGTNSFFKEQTKAAAEEVDRLETQFLEFKNKTGIAELAQQRSAEIEKIATLEKSLLATTAKLEAARSEMKSRTEILASQPDTKVLSETTGLPSTAAEGMRQQLYALQLEETDLSSRLKADHPRLVMVRTQVKAAQQELERETALRQVTKGTNETHREMEYALLNQIAISASLQAEQSILKEQISEARDALKEINENEFHLAKLTRELDLARANYLDYAKRSEQSRVDVAISDERLSDLSVLQAPSISRIPSSPKLFLTLVASVTAGTFLAVFSAVLLEWRRLRKHRGKLTELAVADFTPSSQVPEAALESEDVANSAGLPRLSDRPHDDDSHESVSAANE